MSSALASLTIVSRPGLRRPRSMRLTSVGWGGCDRQPVNLRRRAKRQASVLDAAPSGKRVSSTFVQFACGP